MQNSRVAYLEILSRRSSSRFYGRALTSRVPSAVCSIRECDALFCFSGKERSIARPDVRSPYGQILRTRLKKRRLRQERCARRDAWELAKRVRKLNEKHKATFFSPSDVSCLPAPSSVSPEEREFVVDSESSMRMLSRKDLNSVELETVRVSRNPTTVITQVVTCKRTRKQRCTSTIRIYS